MPSLDRVADQLEDVGGLARAERRRRLVEDHDPLAERDRPRAGDGLALAAGEQPDLRLRVGQLDLQALDQLVGLLAHRARRRPTRTARASAPRVRSRPAKKLPTGPVLSNSARSWNTVSIPSSRALVRRVDPHRFAVEPDLAAVGLLDAGEHLDQRRLAGAVVAEQREHLALAQRQRDVAQRGRRAVLLAQVLDLEHGARRRARPRARTAS